MMTVRVTILSIVFVKRLYKRLSFFWFDTMNFLLLEPRRYVHVKVNKDQLNF